MPATRTARVGSRRNALALMAGAAAAACTCCRRASAQELLRLGPTGTCGYTALVREPEVYTFASSADARTVVKRIVDQVGLPQNFVVRAASDVGNAAAVISEQNGEKRRFILYSENFMLRLARGVHKDWPALSFLAHEVRHHYAANTLLPGGSRPSTEL